MGMLETEIHWIHKLAYVAKANGHEMIMDAKKSVGGLDIGMTPKEMVLAGLSGCSGMDVISLLSSKHKLPVKECEVFAKATTSEGTHPVVFTHIQLTFKLSGELPKEKVIEAVNLSMTKFCGVSAMLAKACPIDYVVELNGESISQGQAFRT